jgi:hypothetical protein
MGQSGFSKDYAERYFNTLEALESLGDQARPTELYWRRVFEMDNPAVQVLAARRMWTSDPTAATAAKIMQWLRLDRRLTWHQNSLLGSDSL